MTRDGDEKRRKRKKTRKREAKTINIKQKNCVFRKRNVLNKYEDLSGSAEPTGAEKLEKYILSTKRHDKVI